MAKHGKASKRASARPRGMLRKRADAANHHPRAEAPRNTEFCHQPAWLLPLRRSPFDFTARASAIVI